MQGSVLENLMEFWQTQLAQAPRTLDLPYDYPRPSIEPFDGAIHSFSLDPDLTVALDTLRRSAGLTRFMALLAAFQILLYRYSGQGHIPVGTDVANRDRPELDSVMGCFVNQLVLCSHVQGSMSVGEFLNRVRETCLKAYAHQELPFDLLVAHLSPTREAGITPIFQAKLVLHNQHVRPLALTGLTATPMRIQRVGAKFDLTLTFQETDEALQGTLEYRTSIFNETTIATMAERLVVLLRAMTQDPTRRISDLPLLSDTNGADLPPAEFTAAGISRQDLENILLQLGGE
jgi:non-ribosomal peptide synthetase component F